MSPRVQRVVGVLLAIVVALAVFAGTAVFAAHPDRLDRADRATLDPHLAEGPASTAPRPAGSADGSRGTALAGRLKRRTTAAPDR